MTGTPWLALVAIVPLVVVLWTMIDWRWSGTKAGAAGWGVALVLAFTVFQADATLLWYAHLRSVLLSLYVLYIIWMALLLYHVTNEAKAIQDISAGVARLTGDSLIQLLLLGWLFTSFLQGVSGFGVPVAVVTPLLAGLGFDPLLAVAAATIAHGWSVTFGSAGTSFFTLVAVTGIPGEVLAGDSALLLGAAAFLCGGSVAHLHSGWAGVRRGALFIGVTALVAATTQYLLAQGGFYAVAAFGGAFAGMVAAVPLARLPFYRGEAAPRLDNAPRLRTRLPLAVSVYGLFLVVIPAADGIPWLNEILNRVELNLTFPEVTTGLGWLVAAGEGRSVSVFGHPGALIGYIALIAFGLFALAGRFEAGAAGRIVRNTIKGSRSSTLGILLLVAMATIMDNSGMIYAIAVGIQSLVPGWFYPMVAPWIGALGAFITGSNTNSNVLFAPLQQQVALLIPLSVPAILAAQTAGASVGSVLSPAKLVVGAILPDLAGREGDILRKTAPYAVVLMVAVGLMTYWLL